MSNILLRRLGKEIKDVQSDKQSGITLEPLNVAGASGDTIEDLTHFTGVFAGPPETPYADGLYAVDIRIPDKYPFQPPAMKFTTKIWHPNVSSVTGAICLDTLGKAWSPILTLKSALISVQSLLSSPEPNDPQDAEVARMLMHDPREFDRVARQWAIKYAGAPPAGTQQHVSTATSSGGVTEETLRQQSIDHHAHQQRQEAVKQAQYHGYNRKMIDKFTAMGFEVPAVVAAFEAFGIDHNRGEYYELEEEYNGDVMAHLLHEPLDE